MISINTDFENKSDSPIRKLWNEFKNSMCKAMNNSEPLFVLLRITQTTYNGLIIKYEDYKIIKKAFNKAKACDIPMIRISSRKSKNKSKVNVVRPINIMLMKSANKACRCYTKN